MIDDKILPVTDDVTWIGVLDPGLVTFDIVMETKYGTTYNSYFINAEKKAVVETTKERFWPTYLDKIKQVTDPSEIEYIIVDALVAKVAPQLLTGPGIDHQQFGVVLLLKLPRQNTTIGFVRLAVGGQILDDAR